MENSELEDDKQSEVIGALHALVPEYAQYHWRHLHESVKDASYSDYKNEDYYLKSAAPLLAQFKLKTGIGKSSSTGILMESAC